MSEKKKIRFQPLESNPESINQYLVKLGVDSSTGVSDILGFTDDLLAFVLRPVRAVIFLYPYDHPNIESDFSLLQESDEERAQKDRELGKDLYVIEQTIGNACGTIALIHALANNRSVIKFEPDSLVKKFIDSTLDKTPEERGQLLEEQEAMAAAHKEAAEAGETEMNMNTNLHFVALAEHNGFLWKFDGHNKPEKRCIRVNTATKGDVLESSAEYLRKFMEKNPDLLQFAALSINQF